MISFIHTYRGIGDTIYSIPAIREVCKRHEVVYGPTAFPHLYSSIPNFRPLNPFQHDWGGEWVTSELTPMYFEHAHDAKGEFDPDPPVARLRDLLNCGHGYRVALTLQQFQPGRNMIRHCLPGVEPTDLELRLPAYPGRFDLVTEEFFTKEQRTWRNPILFHAVDQNLPECVSDRACPNIVFTQLLLTLKRRMTYFTFDARRYDSDRPLLFSQCSVPVYNSTGWPGICGIMSLMKRSFGVVLQNSCSLLPIAQAMGKPVLVLNGPCGLRLEHCTDAGMPDYQRRHVWVEPDDYCACKTKAAGCRKPVARYPDLEEKLEQFISML